MSNIFDNMNKENNSLTITNPEEEKSKPNEIILIPSINIDKNSILSLLIKKGEKNRNKRRNSVKTADTNIILTLNVDYDLKDVHKFDELNNSLSDISEFDLEEGDDDNKSEFNSSEDDNSNEEEDIVIKSKCILNKKNYDSEYKIELEKECNEIINKLNINKKF